MLKTLIKKQFLECFRAYFVSTKTGKARSKASRIGMFVFFAALMLYLAGMFYMLSYAAGEALLGSGLSWLYYTAMGTVSILLGTFGSVFTTYSMLYLAKDNDMLLAMPIKPSLILSSRMVLVFAMSLLYSGVAWIPAVVNAWINGSADLAGVLFDVLLIFVIALFVTVLTCVLGWAVAMIVSRVRNRNFLVVVLSLVFFGAYYYFCMNMFDTFQFFLLHMDAVGNGIRTWANVLYQLGNAASGDAGAMAIFTGTTAAAFAVCFVVLSRSFTGIITRTQGTTRRSGKVKIHTSGIWTALLGRELRLFTSSATYMLNAGLGIAMLPVAAIIAIVKRKSYIGILKLASITMPKLGGMLPLAVLLAVCMVAGMNAVSAPSISLEGKRLWILRSLPVSGREVLNAKLALHILLNLPSVLFAAIALGWCLDLKPLTMVLTVAFCMVFLWLTAGFGLIIGVLRPNFDWTTDTQPIKQSLNVLFAMLFAWMIPLLLGVGYYFLQSHIGADAYIGIALALITVTAAAFHVWLNTKGAAVFERL